MLDSPNEPLPGQPIRSADIAAIIRYGRQTTLRSGPGRLVRSGSGGQTVGSPRKYFPAPLYPPAGSQVPWPFKLYKVINASGAFVQVNGGDGAVASLSPFDASPHGIALVSGTRNDTKTGSPPAYPLLPITGNGDVYAYCTLNASGQVTAVNVYYAGTAPSPDTANPPTYGVKLLGTITDYEAGSPPSFTLADANGPQGITTVSVCASVVYIT